ncbi:rho GTPase-activating protein 33-like, partial [Gallus gallus]|uniref:rho GTPase-activating protein 33-like n=1 Tax=Gallus gallus TaxID=9031 RepID=UPI001AEB8942
MAESFLALLDVRFHASIALSFSSKEEACSSAAGLSGWDVTGAAAEAGLESGAQLTAGTCSVVPQVLQSCAEFIEQHGVVQGIYRLSGVASKIQKLRHEFESEQIPELSVRDVHSVSSLCKMYFRELPTPLLTEQLYGKFSDAVCAATDEERLLRMQEVIQ